MTQRLVRAWRGTIGPSSCAARDVSCQMSVWGTLGRVSEHRVPGSTHDGFDFGLARTSFRPCSLPKVPVGDLWQETWRERAGDPRAVTQSRVFLGHTRKAGGFAPVVRLAVTDLARARPRRELRRENS